MERVGFNASLDDCGRQVDSLSGKGLHQCFGDDPSTHVASGWGRMAEVAGFKNIHFNIDANPKGHIEKKIGKKRTGRTATDNRDLRTLV
jgi:hypothetical protein